MKQYTDEYWYEMVLNENSAAGPLTSIQKSIIIKKCIQEAEQQKKRIESEYGKQQAKEYLKQMGFTIERDEGELMPSFLYMELMEPDCKKVCLNQTVISLVEEYMCRRFSEDTAQLEKFREIVCFHELFHVIEEYIKDIYTRNVRVKKHFMHIAPYYVKVDAASEIGAIHFSKIMSDVQFSPYIYTQYVLAAVNIDLEVEDEH